MSNDLLKYKIAISLIPKIGGHNARKLIAYCGGVKEVFMQKKSSLMKIPGIGEQLASNIINQNVIDRAEQEVEFIDKNKINHVFYLDKKFPERLKNCNDAPAILFYKGNIDFNREKVISIIGTRNATDYGIENCNKLIEGIIERNHKPIIVSGLAYGIDIAAHRAALKNGLDTIAVFAHGLDTVYPSIHSKTARQIENQGALLTEFLSKTKMDRRYFLQRNRIIAGIADATIVVESAEKGGALVTADIANSYNRDVFAFPGRIFDKYSSGCNWLIKTNKAALITGVPDLEYILGWDKTDKKQIPVQKELFVELTEDEEIVVNLLSNKGKLPIDLISLETKLPMSKISSMLLNLEFCGQVRCLPGKLYALC